MEFYDKIQIDLSLDAMFQFPTGWNSTEVFQYIRTFEPQFQFPTGWNSTEVKLISLRDHKRFNSQRDGILRKFGLRFGAGSGVFQFPTGWNSTRPRLAQIANCRVSIPNGMEFYVGKQPGAGKFLWFQFPTGWNSTIV